MKEVVILVGMQGSGKTENVWAAWATPLIMSP